MATVIWVVSPPNYLHSHAFDEIALAMSSALRALGHEVPVVRHPPAGADIATGDKLGAALADQDATSRHKFAAERLDAQPT